MDAPRPPPHRGKSDAEWGVNDGVIERVINHVEQNRMKRIYQRYDHAEEMRTAWASLGALLTKLSKPVAASKRR